MVSVVDVLWTILDFFLALLVFILVENLVRSLLHKQAVIAPDTVPEKADGLIFVGHSTMLFRLAGTVVLTDPVLTSRYFGFNRRFVSVGARLEDLAAVDVVVISHTHADHNHPASLRVLARYNRHLTICVPAGYARRYRYAKRYKFANVVEVPRYKSVQVQNLTITNVPAEHISSWGASGWVFQGAKTPEDEEKAVKTIYFAGDTAYNQAMFQEIGVRFAIDLAFLPMGCYEGDMFFHLFHPSFRRVHMSPFDIPQAMADLHAHAVVPIHWGTFIIGSESIQAAPNLFRELQTSDQMPSGAFLAVQGTWHPFTEILICAACLSFAEIAVRGE